MSTPPSQPVYVVGDVHGQFDPLRSTLREAGMIDGADQWAAGASTLWFMGDFCDRGPDGVSAIELAMRLQTQAAAAGGSVKAILGNHDVLILAAHKFGPDAGEYWREHFWADWLLNGGQLQDLRRFTPDLVRWLSQLPLLAKVGQVLLAHADSTFYLDYGDTLAAVNRAGEEILAENGQATWDLLLEQFTQRRAFSADATEGPLILDDFLKVFGATRLIHGHTPIPLVTRVPARQVRTPFVYAGDRAVNVDAGLFLGSPGFVFQIPAEWI